MIFFSDNELWFWLKQWSRIVKISFINCVYRM